MWLELAAIVTVLGMAVAVVVMNAKLQQGTLPGPLPSSVECRRDAHGPRAS
jgi:hypothetical protein